MEYTIDLRNVTDPESMHDIIEQSIPVPDYYGRNLDALYDVLTSMPSDTVINIFSDLDRVYEYKLPRCIQNFLQVCEDAGSDQGIEIIINPDDV